MMTRAVLLLALALSAIVAAVDAIDIKIKRKPRIIREPVPIRDPAPFRTGLLDDKTEPLTRYSTIENESGDITLHPFQNITFLSPTKKVLLGLWKGYEVNEATQQYHALLFDDGDLCPQDRSKRYSVRLELVRREYEGMREYLQSADVTQPCQLTLKLELFASDAQMTLLPEHADRVVAWYEDPTSPKVLCRSIKCDYATVLAQVDIVAEAVESLRAHIATLPVVDAPGDAAAFVSTALQASSTVLATATTVLGQASHVYARLTDLEPATCSASRSQHLPAPELAFPTKEP
ncbi:hypothetical protein ACHHYP_13425 [Achlya hypogyna]|uniref:Secreted protein n=1 Tax=Achlya hypogyna TaxID=1202772 RepID=A0A0A7CP66_ACHHY|nr:secreted protein [Achlya hypogyna]OQR84400.1 hypothetical protein ACHHYP_13425 [Achlya hypogyna]